MRTLVAALLVPFALAAVVGTALLFPFGDGPDIQHAVQRPVDGVITGAVSGSCSGEVQVGRQPEAPQCLVVTIRMTDGEAPGQEIRTVVPLEPSTPRFAVDDEVVLSYGGGDPLTGSSYQLVDFQRDVPLTLLAGLFAVAVLVLGRWQGLKALLALGMSFLVLVFFVLPAIIAGENPLLVAICGAGVIMFAVLYLTHGLSARTSTAVLGTMVSLALIGVLGALWAAFAKLTGLDEDTATLVGLLNAPIDTRGLLLAGVVIGALGVLDDVTVTQTSAVWELRAANPLLTRRQLYTSALRIGRDHVASAVNTLVMAYAGAALPLLLYSSISGVELGSILTSQSIAQEVVRTLVGSIGLVAAVPITTALAAAVAAQEKVPEPAGPRETPRKRTGSAERGEKGARQAGTPGRELRTRTTPRAGDSGREADARGARRTGDRAGESGTRRTHRTGDRAGESGTRGARRPDDRAGESGTRGARRPDDRSGAAGARRAGDQAPRRSGDGREAPPARRAEHTGHQERAPEPPDNRRGRQETRRTPRPETPPRGHSSWFDE
ncbi:YibE/F family protein [Actinophytocola sp. S1-96]|uniref:YibE/F family protein n=1 Tax=Actinophytocola gossypii TaxID=2812003 RepID=A0ABT2J5Z5_9PSEU|nr:YibE/F family protein [Actinophytocola gossypii]